MIENIKWFFDVCVYILQCLGGSCGQYGLGYEIANILIFVIIQPALIILFFLLWQRERNKNK